MVGGGSRVIGEGSSAFSPVSSASSATTGARVGSSIAGNAASGVSIGSSSSSVAGSSAVTTALASASASEALLMSIRSPVSLAASLTFCPSLPMARESWLSGTTTVAVSSSSFTVTLSTWAGLRPLVMKIGLSGCHITTSIFSPFSSLTMFCILMPLRPTQQPTGSMPSWSAATATLLRYPASRAMDFSSTMPLRTSGTSSSKSRRNRLG